MGQNCGSTFCQERLKDRGGIDDETGDQIKRNEIIQKDLPQLPRDSIVSVKSTLGKESNQDEVMKLQGEDIDDMTVNEEENEDH